MVVTYGVCYWDARELREFINSLTVALGRPIRIVDLRDRSILVGRHMDTGHFNGHPRAIRQAVNRLFHRDLPAKGLRDSKYGVQACPKGRLTRPRAGEEINRAASVVRNNSRKPRRASWNVVSHRR